MSSHTTLLLRRLIFHALVGRRRSNLWFGQETSEREGDSLTMGRESGQRVLTSEVVAELSHLVYLFLARLVNLFIGDIFFFSGIF